MLGASRPMTRGRGAPVPRPRWRAALARRAGCSAPRAERSSVDPGVNRGSPALPEQLRDHGRVADLDGFAGGEERDRLRSCEVSKVSERNRALRIVELSAVPSRELCPPVWVVA